MELMMNYMNENTCFFIITDGFGTVNSPHPLGTLENMLNIIRHKNGCATCSYCFWWNFLIPIPNLPKNWQAEKETVLEVCKRLNAPVIEINQRNYKQRVA